MARKTQVGGTELDDADDVADIEAAEKALEEDGPLVRLEDFKREVGTVVEAAAIPFEVRLDGSIAHFTHDAAKSVRELGS